MLVGKTTRQILMNLNSKQARRIRKSLNLDSELLVSLEDALYPVTKGMNMTQYKQYLENILRPKEEVNCEYSTVNQ